ncbi:LysR family transcriptional regulator [Brachybacterium sp. AOP42-C2-15]|uniref:LysR family transcriptional regulator n=1 Tax=unclassified Brachybacterium TaxID=2623841 RepID=UPI003FDB202B
MNQSDARRLLPDLPVLVELARTGTISEAALVLGMQQPSASRAVARLAQHAGVRLTARQGRSVVLTDAGRHLAEAGTEALALLENGLIAARRQAGTENALISISYQAALGESYLPRAIAHFRTFRRTTRFQLSHGSRRGTLDAVRDGSADLALVAEPENVPGGQVAVLFDEPLVALASTQHPIARLHRPLLPEDLRAHELVILSAGYGLHDSIVRLLADVGGLPESVFEVDDYRVAQGLAAAGVGVTVLPPSAVTHAADVVELPIAHPEARRTIGVVTGPDPSPIVEDFVDVLHIATRGHRRAPGTATTA